MKHPVFDLNLAETQMPPECPIRVIPIPSRNTFALVDIEDFEYLRSFNWNLSKKGYAVRNNSREAIRRGEGHAFKMHRVVLKTESTVQVDHQNRDKLDNRKRNLRGCTNAENKRNSGKFGGEYTSKFKGVSLKKGSNRWAAYIRIDGKIKHLGYFSSEDEAAREYDKFARLHYGEFANPNFL